MKNIAVRNDFIRYSNCWEDAAVLARGLAPIAGSNVLSIGSAGDNSLLLLAYNPKLVVATDINTAQLMLIELKKVAFKTLEYQELLAFLGAAPCTSRKTLFDRVAAKMPNNAHAFWKQNMAAVQRGVLHMGKFEKYFAIFSKYVLPFIHRKGTTSALLAQKSAVDQVNFYDKKWNTWRWRMLFKIFFSKWVMGRLGRDPAFLAQVKVPVSKYIFNNAETHLRSTFCQKNNLLHYIFLGDFGSQLPEYLLPEHYETIKKNIDNLKLFQGFAHEIPEEFGMFNRFNLSDIFEYMDADTFRKVAQKLAHRAAPNARFVYWNLMVQRELSAALPEIFCAEKELSQAQKAQDKGFFYAGVKIDVRK